MGLMISWDYMGCRKSPGEQNSGRGAVHQAGGSLTTSEWCGLLLDGRCSLRLGQIPGTESVRSYDGVGM